MRRRKRVFHERSGIANRKRAKREGSAHTRKQASGGNPGSYEAKQATRTRVEERSREKMALYRRDQAHRTEGDIERAKRRAKIRHTLIMKELE
jgi:hypothetical protein|tara:strand:+ start:1102 stop:1380 length:279 start_codon:yes stop_codon:yes gene_type:complete